MYTRGSGRYYFICRPLSRMALINVVGQGAMKVEPDLAIVVDYGKGMCSSGMLLLKAII
jgi:hypothetical protein